MKKDAHDNDTFAWEWTIVYDGDPVMGGGHQRQQVGAFNSLEAAEQAYQLVSIRSTHAPKQNLHMERRLVGPWESWEPSEATMTVSDDHDPLCPFDPDATDASGVCRCDLITRVRTDTLARQRRSMWAEELAGAIEMETREKLRTAVEELRNAQAFIIDQNRLEEDDTAISATADAMAAEWAFDRVLELLGGPSHA